MGMRITTTGFRVAVIGGAALGPRLDLLRQATLTCDAILLGGGVASAFLKRPGHGPSDDPARVEEIRALAGDRLHLPRDIVYAYRRAVKARAVITRPETCPQGAMILDIGPATVRHYLGLIARADRIDWTGPVGAAELPPFDQATRAIALGIAALTREGLCESHAAGADTAAAIERAGVTADFTSVCPSGTALLHRLAGTTLSGTPAQAAAA